MAAIDTDEWSPGDPIGYITEEVPEFQTHPYQGDRYEAFVPDTLDLQERARLVILRSPRRRTWGVGLVSRSGALPGSQTPKPVHPRGVRFHVGPVSRSLQTPFIPSRPDAPSGRIEGRVPLSR